MVSWEDISYGLLELETDSVLWVVSIASPLTCRVVSPAPQVLIQRSEGAKCLKYIFLPVKGK